MIKLQLLFVLGLSISWTQNYNVPDDFEVKYQAGTRGHQIYLMIKKDSTSLKVKTIWPHQSCDTIVATDKKELDQIINEINLISFDSSYIAPSNQRASDRDLGADLKIIKNGKQFSTNSYDYSNPNISLRPLDSLLKNQIDIIKKLL
jgi:hypothetical protein